MVELKDQFVAPVLQLVLWAAFLVLEVNYRVHVVVDEAVVGALTPFWRAPHHIGLHDVEEAVHAHVIFPESHELWLNLLVEEGDVVGCRVETELLAALWVEVRKVLVLLVVKSVAVEQ